MKMTTLRESDMDYSQEIFSLLTDVYNQSPWTLQQIERDMKLAHTEYLYLIENQKLLGFLAVQDLAGELEITQIAVRKDYQGQGLANQLMNTLSSRSEPVFLEVRESNKAARGLYEKFGFKKVGLRKKYYQNPVEDAVLMAREGQLG
ncbi:ribosomal-protein-alanine acetyltransferase [Streptococcus varani]|uniref:[Ribosomal protein bS18]-alanine N-acetyltransferase n=1 Tax=Streptococcus varani TaxID=1608583 RepID=A0A0E4H460_9STRE|nr:ribosomal protein S18-alanine N-acetyltransferase [Streptococcus varani]CQR24046.1 ribosomal-protein-alanine acetyltransferase [Streptococcus varani]